MTMTVERFEQLVERLEAGAEQAPRAYKFRVFLLALLGYGYIFAILAVLLLLIGLIILLVAKTGRGVRGALNIGIPLLTLASIVARSLWVRLDPPAGLPLQRHQAARLFQAVEAIGRE
ncbi:MAG: peptidase, partial [Chloroflexota bacterium]|nr:peptidase [Chloroflexota bacterium]